MPENKKQHYVPQFYLRLFSKDRTNIYNYHLNSKKLSRMPIKDICQGSHFYDNEGEYEKMLSGLEQLQSKIIKRIIENQSLDGIQTEDYFKILLFLLLQQTRTKKTKITMDKIIDDLLNEFIIPFTNRTQEKDIGSVKVTVEKSQILAMAPAMMGVELIMDLLPILIVNNTDSDFITSDAPVVLYNYVKTRDCSLLGFQSPGLQIYCPLNEKLLLLFIHADLYKVTLDSKSTITLKKASDVDELNKLQFLNCLHSVICSDEVKLSYLINLHKSIEDKIGANIMEVKYVNEDSQEKGKGRETIKISRQPIDYNLKLSFIKLNHQGDRVFKPWIKKSIKRNPTVVPVRDKVICSIVNKRIDENNKEIES